MSTQGQGQDPNQNKNQDLSRNYRPRKPGDACAACKHQRRRCPPNCTLRPYFPQFPDTPNQDLINCVKLFGVQNLIKFIESIDPPYREDAVKSIKYEANARAKDPVGGATGMTILLQVQINQYQRELNRVNAQLAYLKAQNPGNSNVGVQNLSGNLNLGEFPGQNHDFGSNLNVGEQNFNRNMNLNLGYFSAPTRFDNEASSSGLQNDLDGNMNHGFVHDQNPNLSATTRFDKEASSSGLQNILDESMNHGYFPDQNPNFPSRMRSDNEASSSRVQNEFDVNMNLGYFLDQNPNFSAPIIRFNNEAASSSGVQNELNSGMNIYGNVYHHGNMNLVDGDYGGSLHNLFENNASERSEQGINPNSDLNANDLSIGVENELDGNLSLDGNMNFDNDDQEGINLNFDVNDEFYRNLNIDGEASSSSALGKSNKD